MGSTEVKVRADDPAQVFPVERPRYPALERAVNAAWRETQAAFSELRTEWFDQVTLPEPGKALGGDVLRGLGRIVETFLRIFAGKDRTREAFADPQTEHGILQQAVLLSHTVGMQRAADLTTLRQSPQFNALQQQRVLEKAFDRLSVDGKLRFETRLEEIRSAMVDGFREGAAPVQIARRLGRDLDGYEQGRLKTVIRTEMAIASESAILDTGRSAGVDLWDVDGDPGADDACVSIQTGGPYTYSQASGLTPVHPNCGCTCVPHTE
jgi:hypothetical protein